jgi:hypothetical protein
LNTSAVCETVSLASSDPSEETIVYNIPVPDHLFFYAEPKPVFEGLLLETQPKIRVADVSVRLMQRFCDYFSTKTAISSYVTADIFYN